MKYEVAVVADLCIDLLFQGNVTPIYGQVEQFVDDYTVEIGGSAAIFAAQLTKLGGRVAFIGAVGDDAFGDFSTHRLQELGIASTYLQRLAGVKTAVGLGLAKQDDRAMLTYSGSMQALTATYILQSGVLEQSRHLHLAGYYLLEQLHPFWANTLSSLKAKGMTISLDTNWAPKGNWEAIAPILPLVDVFIPNEAEAMRISGQADVAAAGNWLAQYSGMTIIKQGAEGATVFQGNTIQHFAIPEFLLQDLHIADTTGAGDNFDAGFLYAWLQGAPLKNCVQLAMQCGTRSLSQMGGIAGQIQHALL
ncbi:MAG TPA: carbohydrate kinase family protein [Saprospiraceae bacterium]|nr:carbohydrate kinase family protein [Saprospiraceae bacterium]HMQ83875.1 carbohydrate kinase family protein [Saprospiraceae bacterium]